MADAVAVATPPEATEAADTGGKKKKLLVIVLAVAVVGALAYVFLLGGGSAAAEPAEPVEGAVVPIAEMTTSVGGPQSTYVRVAFAGVLDATADESMLEERIPLMKDAALSVLMDFSAEQLRSEAGAQELRAALTAKAHEVWEDGEVLRVVLTDLLVQ